MAEGNHKSLQATVWSSDTQRRMVVWKVNGETAGIEKEAVVTRTKNS
jgi:hypothetical protein